MTSVIFSAISSGPHDSKPTEYGHVPMSEEFDSPKWTMPAMGPVLGAMIGLAILVFIVVKVTKPKPVSAGEITKVFAVEQTSGDRVLVGIELKVRNISPKQIWIKSLQAKLADDGKEFTDDPAIGSDHPRYFEAYPELKQSDAKPLPAETKIPTGAEQAGLIIVGFPRYQRSVRKENRNHRHHSFLRPEAAGVDAVVTVDRWLRVRTN